VDLKGNCDNRNILFFKKNSHHCFSKSTNFKSQFEHIAPNAFFSIFSCCLESGKQPQEELAKSSCKTNAEIENL
jgi:hypothetical protein